MEYRIIQRAAGDIVVQLSTGRHDPREDIGYYGVFEDAAEYLNNLCLDVVLATGE